jgi:hypothetical protein
MATPAIAILACLTLQAADGLTFETPKGWTRTTAPNGKDTYLQPPDVPGDKECIVIISPPQEFEGTLQAFLDQKVQAATKGNELQGKVQFLDVGSFRVAWIVQKIPSGAMQFWAIHAAQWGKKAQMALFAATDYELMKKHTPAAQEMFLKVAVPGGESIAGLLMPLPKGWTRTDDPAGWIIVTPPAEMATPSKLFIATRKIEGTHWTAHRALLKSLIEEAKWKDPYPTAAIASPGPFIASEVNSTTSASVIRLYTALSASGQMEVVVVTPDMRGTFGPAVMSILERTTVKNPAPAPKRPEVVEAYRRPNMRKFINADGTISYASLKYERMVFLSNGVVDFSMTYPEGMAASPDLLKVDAGTENGFYGSWKAEGKTLRIRREAGKAEEAWEKETGALKFGDQVWAPMPRVDGLRLKGRWSYRSDPANKDLVFNYWIEFTEDGNFKTGGLLSWLAAGDLTGRAKPPESAAGTYEIRDWTIWFKVNGAVVWSTDITTLKDDPKDLETLLINTYSFKRE